MREGFIDDVLSACVSSPSTDKLKLIEDHGKVFETRSQIHALIVSPFGTRKSTDVIKIPNSYQLMSFSAPAILGSISKNGEFVEGALTRSAGKVFVVDEFHNLPEKARQAMLHLLEQQEYTRSLGFKAIRPFKMNKKFCKIDANGNQWHMKVRFSCICSGVYAPRKRINDRAWLSRFIPVEYQIDIKDIYDMVRGKKMREITQHKYKNVPVFEDYMKFVNCHEKLVNELPFVKKMNMNEYGFIARNVIDMARLAAYHSGIRGDSTVNDWEQVLEYVPLSLRNYLKADLTLNEYKIMDALQCGMSLQETSDAIEVSKQYVIETKKKLEVEGLIA